MCLAVYIATSDRVPTVAWSTASPAFYIESVLPGDGVRKQFSLPFVYYAGSHHGCGCGFSKEGEVGAELEQCQANYVALGRTIRQAMSEGKRVELFTCWEGSQSEEPEFVESTTPSALEAPAFQLKELQLLRIEPDA